MATKKAETIEEKELSASEKKRLANIEKSKPKRQAKAKEYEQLLEKVERGETTAPIVGQSQYLPNQVYKESMTGNELYANTIRNMMEFYKQEPVLNDNELCDRLVWYFSRCADTGQLITFEKMCIAMGYEKAWLSDIISGRRSGFSPDTAKILKKATEFVASCDGELALQSKIQPVVYMFRAKNFYDMADKQEHIITPNNPLSDYQDQATIEAKYKQLPSD